MIPKQFLIIKIYRNSLFLIKFPTYRKMSKTPLPRAIKSKPGKFQLVRITSSLSYLGLNFFCALKRQIPKYNPSN